MQEKTQSFKSLVEKSNKILLIFPHIINADVTASLGLVYKTLKEKFNKEVEVAASRPVPVRFHDILKTAGIEPHKVFTEIKPVSYVIKVNDAKDSIDVVWEKHDDNIELILTPDTKEIDFKKISFSREGGTYDLVITFNAPRLEDLGRIYTEFQKQYGRYDIVSFDYQNSSADYAKVSVHDENGSTTSETVYRMLSDLGYSIDKIEAETVAQGILGSTYGLHQNVKNPTFKIVSELANKYQVDLTAINNKFFYSLSKEGLNLRERMLRNAKFDDSRKTVYSTLTSRDFQELGVNPNDLDGMDYLPFNIVKDFDIAFIAFEDGTRTNVLIQSNRFSKDLNPILKKLNGIGNRASGWVSLNGDANSASISILNAILEGAPIVNTQPQSIPQIPSINVQTSMPAPQPQAQQPQPSYIPPMQAPAPQMQPMPQPQAKPEPKAEVKQEQKTQAEEVKAEVVSPKTELKNEIPVFEPKRQEEPAQEPVKQTEPAPVQQPAPVMENPFKKADKYTIDSDAEPMKAPANGSYNFQNTPFEKAK